MSKPFYLKIAFEGKIKKYAVTHIRKINFKQIHQHLGLGRIWNDAVFYYQLVDNFADKQKTSYIILNESQLLARFCQSPPQQGSTVKLRILQRELMSEQQRRRKESEELFQVPGTLDKKRSRSLQLDMDVLDQTCQTEVLQTPINFSYTPTNTTSNDCPISSHHSQQIPSHHYSLSGRKFFSKSTQVSSEFFSSQLHSQHTIVSFTKTPEFERIQNCLDQSIKVTERQKTELQKLRDKIRRRQNQLQKSLNIIPNVKSLFQEIGLMQQ